MQDSRRVLQQITFVSFVCVSEMLKENLKHFNVVDDFPPNILHAFLGGMVPAELSHSFGLFNKTI